MSDRLEEARRAAEQRLEETRREAERRLTEVREAVSTEAGFVPKRKYVLLALAAGAAGFALAVRRRKGKGHRAPKRLKSRSR